MGSTTDTSFRRQIAGTDLDVFPICLGGNVFGWTADRRASFEVLDAYLGAGGNFVDTADQYSNWAPGHSGGESETEIGRWLASRGNREQVILATKVGHMGGLGKPGGLTARSIAERTDASLGRLGVDHVDLLYAHIDDPATPLAETMAAFDEVVRAGKARYVAASNYTADRLRDALTVSREEGRVSYVCLQAHYNLLERSRYEGSLATAVAEAGLSCIPYWALAKGYLTGKYSGFGSGGDQPSERSTSSHFRVHEYDDARARDIVEVVAEIAADHSVKPTAIVLAWTIARPTVVSALASARTAGQVGDIVAAPGVRLSPSEMGILDQISAV